MVTISDASQRTEISTKEVPIVQTETKTITYESPQVQMLYNAEYHFGLCLGLGLDQETRLSCGFENSISYSHSTRSTKLQIYLYFCESY